MDLKAKIRSLSDIEKKCLKVLSQKEKEISEISKEANINIDSVRRAVNWLNEKGFAKITHIKTIKAGLTKEGKNALENGLPEQKMLDVLSEEGMSFDDAMKKANLSQQEFNVALGLNKRKNFVIISKKEKPMLELTGISKGFENEEKKELEKISQGETPDSKISKELIARGLIEEKEEIIRKISITKEGSSALSSKEFSEERNYNIHEKVPELFIGKKQPYIQFLNNIRKKLVALGFKEMPERLVNQEFYNFDVLFQPQNHPARTWTDTYQLKNPKIGKLPKQEKVNAIKHAHEHGGKTISKGWGYNWNPEIAAKLMPTAHGTAADARQMIEGVEYPRKYFVINRCFRPDVLDATHLIEFNQLDGFIVGEGLSFRSLLGVLKDFAIEIAGATDVKFFPDYYPFTEPSVQLSAKHPDLGWVEFAGAGIFRPEITESLGIKEPVLAWGMGVDRLAMFKLGIKDIRHLFSDDLAWLRKSKMVID
ncbi:MAG: phenylalanine--tRNA ligase subunit alpha [Candidatus Diapherotrites archaeon]